MAQRILSSTTRWIRWYVVTTLLLGGVEVAAQQSFPAGAAPYSAGVLSGAGSTLAVVGAIEGRGSSVAAAATDALRQVAARFEDVGLARGQILKIRAGLVPGDGSEFTEWDRAWTDFFSGGHLPARTTVGSAGLPDGVLVILDAVAVFPAGSGYPVQVAGARSTLNPNIRLAGPASGPTAIVSTRSGLFISSGALPGRNLADPESLEDHMRSSLNSLTGVLTRHGLAWPDVFFVRVMPTPQPDRDSPDFAAWAPVYETMADLAGGQAPPYTIWSAPGFSSSNRYSEIEVWAVPHSPPAAFSTTPEYVQNPLLRMTGIGTRGALANGALIAPNAELLWLSGVVAPAGTAPEEESAAAFQVLKDRLAMMGASVVDVAELRVYRVDGPELSAAFNAAYGAEFNTEDSPHKPVRTNYLVESLPGGRHVEIEVLAVRQPRAF
jgi:enamine deaminase RidA (YjgF/YER057c/UK114 family)